jgi:hypothetical protein
MRIVEDVCFDFISSIEGGLHQISLRKTGFQFCYGYDTSLSVSWIAYAGRLFGFESTRQPSAAQGFLTTIWEGSVHPNSSRLLT